MNRFQPPQNFPPPSLNIFNDLPNKFISKKNSLSSASEEVGVDSQEWKNILENIRKGSVEFSHLDGIAMEEQLDVILQNINRLKCPITLNPNKTGFYDVALHALLRQRLGSSTIEKHLRYARFMENHPVPVDFRNLTIENFTQHMDYREQIENATPNALIHEWKAMKMFLRAYGLPIWDYKPPTPPKSNRKILPFPELVREFWHYKYHSNRYIRKLYQYMFFISYNIGIRVPSELAILKISDIIFNRNGTAILTITEPKKCNSERSIILPYELATDPRHKSMKNWLNSWRPLVANANSGDYLFLQLNGRPFSVRHLGHKLSEQGKRVWSYFHPYVMRHWCAVAKLIEQKVNIKSFDCIPVKNWLGHEAIQTTMNYVRYAEQYYTQAPYNWLKRVLKHPRMEESTLNPTKAPKTSVSGGTPPGSRSGPEEI